MPPPPFSPPRTPPNQRRATTAASFFPDEVWEHVFSYVSSPTDRTSVALVCRAWRRLESTSRRQICVGNCYAVSPRAVATRFGPALRAVRVKGKPHFADFNLVPYDWGGGAYDWVAALAEACPGVEEIRMKRMVVTDECLEMMAAAFVNFKVLEMVSCEGFSTAGLGAIAAYCRKLEVLELQECDVEDRSGQWLNRFPETSTSLVSLNLACLEGEMNVAAIERIVTRCTNLRALKLNHTVSLDSLVGIVRRAPGIVDLGTGRFSTDPRPELYSKLESAFAGCKSLRSLSGVWEACHMYLPAIYSVCDGLTALNLSFATMQSPELVKLVTRCRNLKKLWVLDYIEDDGLEAVASSCKSLEELRVFPSDPYGAAAAVTLTERGLVTVSAGCPKLNSVLFFCRQMTNDALITVARNRPNMIRFRLCIIEPHTPDYTTLQPLDVGFAAIVEYCKSLRRLSLSGILTDRVFEAIGAKANCLEMLSVAFAGDSDAGLHYILAGCRSLRKLEIRDCPFGDKALLANAAKLLTMRSLWMSSCSVSLGACKMLAKRMPWLNVEVISEKKRGPRETWTDDSLVEKLYVYRTLAGPRSDAPACVWTV